MQDLPGGDALFKRQECGKSSFALSCAQHTWIFNGAGSTEPPSAALQQVPGKREKGGNPPSLVISSEPERLFQPEQRRAHLHINVSAVEETSARYRTRERAPDAEPDVGTVMMEKGLQRETCASRNLSLGVYRQVTLCHGTATHFSQCKG